jgi:broad specificity phosphatase PhoE
LIRARLLVTRHGESEWNAAGRWQGHADPPLTARGREQAERAARAARGLVERVVASDLQRAAETARIVGAHLALEVAIVAALRERDVGSWSGLTMAEVEARWPGWVSDGRRPDDAEQDEPMWERIVAGFRTAAEARGTALVVAHGGVISLLERRLGDPRGKVHNLEARWLEVRDDGGLALGDRIRLDADPADAADRPVR